ncbi:MAG TPA: thiamine pyrophosphate-dependent enzyme [Mycobacterium sp.]
MPCGAAYEIGWGRRACRDPPIRLPRGSGRRRRHVREINAAVRAALPDDAVLTGDSSQVTYFGSVHFFDVPAPRRFCYSPGFATLGYGLPAGLGAAIGRPGAPVAVLLGCSSARTSGSGCSPHAARAWPAGPAPRRACTAFCTRWQAQ